MSRKRHEEHANHEAWAIPYGDLVTLLLAFFVVMYAMSSVNEGKYRILSDSLVAAFRSAPKSLEPVQVGEPSKSKQPLQLNRTRTLVPLEVDDEAPDAEQLEQEELRERDREYMRRADLSREDLDKATKLIEQLSEAISEQLEELVKADLVRVRRERFWLEIEINTSVLFDTASAELAPESVPVLERISQTLAGTPTKIQVEGHTDTRPIRTVVFPSNWELSAARAASVVRLFVANGITPEHLAAVGFGEFRRVAENDTSEGQRKNRRVVIVVMARDIELSREVWARTPDGEAAPPVAPAADPTPVPETVPLAQVTPP